MGISVAEWVFQLFWKLSAGSTPSCISATEAALEEYSKANISKVFPS
jgi:roadblock/LC7 domain-containing protein